MEHVVILPKQGTTKQAHIQNFFRHKLIVYTFKKVMFFSHLIEA